MERPYKAVRSGDDETTSPVRKQRRSMTASTLQTAPAVGLEPATSLVERSSRAVPADATEIADLLVADLELLIQAPVRRVTREMVVPVTGERADVAAVGELTWLFEIKSGRDSLRRLRRQSEAFARIGERCVLVAAERHVAQAVEALPVWWGIIEVLNGPSPTLHWHRQAASNPKTDRRTLLLMLRREEAERALTTIDGADRARCRRMSLLAELDRQLDDRAVADCVRAALATRQPRR